MTTYLDLREIAKSLKVSSAVLRGMARRGEFPAVLKVSTRAYRVEQAAFERWLKSRELKPEVSSSEIRPQMLRARELAR